MNDFSASFLATYRLEQGVYCNANLHFHFEDAYLSVRKKENRIYKDFEVAQFPEVAKSHTQYVEWRMRKESLNRVLLYLKAKNPKYILDLGCGNGWFLSHLAKTFPNSICIGMDINKVELQQAARVFTAPNVYWMYEDIFTCELPNTLSFDCVILNGCLQYFENPQDLIHTLQTKQPQDGKIHIIDSPLYKNETDAAAAKMRSIAYFQGLDALASAQYFHHHTWEVLKAYNWRILYRPNLYERLVNKVLHQKYNPFSWICISK